MPEPLIITLTGPSGTGKTVLSEMLCDHGGEKLVSSTTRAARAGEKDGVDYHFLTTKEFLNRKEKGLFLECIHFQEGGNDSGQWYGMESHELERANNLGKPAVIVCEPTGVSQIQRYCGKHHIKLLKVFLNNDPVELTARLMERFMASVEGLTKDSAEYAKKRLSHASRVHRVNTMEQEAWIKPALDGTFPYDMVFPHFDQRSQDSVIQAVMERCQSMRQEPPEDNALSSAPI